MWDIMGCLLVNWGHISAASWVLIDNHLWWVQIFGYLLACRSFSFVCTLHHLIIVKLLWGHWTYKMPVIYILSSVWVRLSIFSQLSIIQDMRLCVFSLPISLVMIEIIYTLSYYHHQIGSMYYYPLFRVRSWNNGMRCMSLYIIMACIRMTSMPRGIRKQSNYPEISNKLQNYDKENTYTGFNSFDRKAVSKKFW